MLLKALCVLSTDGGGDRLLAAWEVELGQLGERGLRVTPEEHVIGVSRDGVIVDRQQARSTDVRALACLHTRTRFKEEELMEELDLRACGDRGDLGDLALEGDRGGCVWQGESEREKGVKVLLLGNNRRAQLVWRLIHTAT